MSEASGGAHGDSGVRVRLYHARQGGRVGEGYCQDRGGQVGARVLGRPDVIALGEAPNHKALGPLVLQKVQRAPGVEGTDTRILVEV